MSSNTKLLQIRVEHASGRQRTDRDISSEEEGRRVCKQNQTWEREGTHEAWARVRW